MPLTVSQAYGTQAKTDLFDHWSTDRLVMVFSQLPCSCLHNLIVNLNRLWSLIFSTRARGFTGDGTMGIVSLPQLQLWINLPLFSVFRGANLVMKLRKLCVHPNFQAHMLRYILFYPCLEPLLIRRTRMLVLDLILDFAALSTLFFFLSIFFP